MNPIPTPAGEAGAAIRAGFEAAGGIRRVADALP